MLVKTDSMQPWWVIALPCWGPDLKEALAGVAREGMLLFTQASRCLIVRASWT